MVKNKDSNNSSNSLVFGRWPQTKIVEKIILTNQEVPDLIPASALFSFSEISMLIGQRTQMNKLGNVRNYPQLLNLIRPRDWDKYHAKIKDEPDRGGMT